MGMKVAMFSFGEELSLLLLPAANGHADAAIEVLGPGNSAMGPFALPIQFPKAQGETPGSGEPEGVPWTPLASRGMRRDSCSLMITPLPWVASTIFSFSRSRSET